MKISEVRFNELSSIEYRMFLYDPSETRSLLNEPQILVMEFKGRYKIGAEGREDSLFMNAMICAALRVWYVKGLILDLRQLSYEWGDNIGEVLLAGKSVMGSKFPTAMIVSDLCRPALETASVLYERDRLSGNQTQWLFDDLDSALGFIEEQISRFN